MPASTCRPPWPGCATSSTTATSAPAPQHIVAAATDRRIPHIRLNDGNLVQLGHGARQRRIWTAETDRTSAIAEGIASDKDLTKELLAAVGVPVPQGRAAKDADEAWEIAQDLGLPVVVKPSRRQPRTWREPGPAQRSRGRGRLRARRARGLRGAGGALHRGQRAPPAGGGRQGGCRRPRRVGLGGGRRQAFGAAAHRPADQHRPAPRADRGLPAQPRDPRGGPGGAAGTGAPGPAHAERARAWAAGADPAQRQCGHRLHGRAAPEVAFQVGLAARTVGLDIAGIDLVCEDIGRPLQARAAPSSRSTPAPAC
jgi:cyanophycin synthetase